MKHILFHLFTLAFVASLSAQTVPAEFQQHYAFLTNKLDAIESRIDAEWDGGKHGMLFSTELLAANSNRGEDLLESQLRQGIPFILDRLTELGVNMISVALDFPILCDDFPRNDEYLDFYTFVGEEVRKRNMKLLVGAQTIFSDTAWSNLKVDYSGYTIESYTAEKRRMIEKIIEHVRPDYLTIENEPETMAYNTGLDFSVDNVIQIIHGLTNGLDRNNVRIGAGTGTWDDPAYIDRMLDETSIDFIDIHIYPINVDFVDDRVWSIASKAATKNLPIIVGETWLYKTLDSDFSGGTANSPNLFSRDVYSFWQPLDIRYIDVLTKLGYLHNFAGINPFWFRNLYAYLDYEEVPQDATPAQLMRMLDQKSAENVLLGVLSPVGLHYKSIISQATGIDDTYHSNATLPISHVYPNPAQETVNVKVLTGAGSRTSIQVLDMLGRKVAEKTGRGDFHILDVSALPIGMYCLHVTVNGQQQARLVAIR